MIASAPRAFRSWRANPGLNSPATNRAPTLSASWYLALAAANSPLAASALPSSSSLTAAIFLASVGAGAAAGGLGAAADMAVGAGGVVGATGRVVGAIGPLAFTGTAPARTRVDGPVGAVGSPVFGVLA